MTVPERREAGPLEVGPIEVGPLEVGPIAHGGHCVARWEGRVLFVRHALPGETVRVRLTDTGHERFWRGDAVQVLAASPDRVRPPCSVARPGGCGGCDFQHIDLAGQRRLKAEVVSEQLRRLAGIDWSVTVAEVPVPEAPPGLRWRRRMRYRIDEQGRPALRCYRSRDTVPVPGHGCLIATSGIAHPPDGGIPGHELLAVAADDATSWVGDQAALPVAVHYTAAGRRWRVTGDGFWQTHPGAADVLVASVLRELAPTTGERAFDLYSGVGLFTGALADAGCTVWSVEGSRQATADAEGNLADVADRVHLRAERVERALRVRPGRRAASALPRRCDLVVLDPPRTGAGQQVMAALLTRRPRAVVYVACDPAALARDLATAAGLGYRLTELSGYDLFPMTQHVECVALLKPTR